MVTLPDTDWRRREGLDALVETLGGGEYARFVGGAVRDALLGLPMADVDIATRCDPEDVMHRLRRAGIKAIPTGIAHGTITAVIASGPVEVTTLRRDVSTDGRHAVVAFTDDWREDAGRRDFTINALYADPATGEVFDYFGGLDDLAVRNVRFIGDPLQRIAEDHLRILRFFRFLARFGDAPDAEGLAACAARANDLMALSRERIRDELLKLLVAKDAVRVVALMLDHAIFAPVLPEVDRDGAARMDELAKFEDAAEIAPDPIRRLAALIGRDQSKAEEIAGRLRLSNIERKRLSSAVEPAFGSPYALGYKLGTAGAIDRLLLSPEWGERFDQLLAVRHLRTWSPPTLPITGGVLVERGLHRGPDVARTLRRIEDRWIVAGFPDDIASIVDEELAQALSATSRS